MIMGLKNICLPTILLLLLYFLSTPIISAPTFDDDIHVIRQRVLELAVWPSPGNLLNTIHDALNYSASLNSSCYWPDINYYDQGLTVWQTAKHMNRTTVMLQAITVNGSTIKDDPKIMAQVHCTLNVWFTNDWFNPNWWYNQIYIPLQATSQLLMLGNNATGLEFFKISEISYRAHWWIPDAFYVGTNLVWMIQIELYRSLATNNKTGIEEGFSRMWQDVVMSNTTSQGIQIDWSYHFHSKQLLSGSYGVIWFQNILLFLQCSQNTQYQPDDQALSILADFLTKGDAWMIITNFWDWLVVGRGISGPTNGFSHGFTTSWIRSFAELVKSNQTRFEILNFADRLDDFPNASLVIGNKHFFTSDYLVHRRSNWVFTIKMQSVRTQPVECINGQNLKGEHGGQGVLNLYRIGFNDYFDLFAIIDWQAINGITVEHDIPLQICHGYFNLERLLFVGGVSDGEYASAFMDTASHNLTAKRSWHFYDDAVIALATNLTLNISTTAWTTLASRLLPQGQVSIGFFNSTVVTLNDGNYTFAYSPGKSSNVQWIHLGDSNIGYILPLEQQYASVGVQVGFKTGNYDVISPFNETITARMVTVFLDHGAGPYVLDYNYMVVPNISLESMPSLIQKYTEEQVFACISIEHGFHGTMWPSLKRASFVVWVNHTTTFSCQSPTFNLNITVTNAGAFLYSETDTDFILTASNPIRENGYLNVTVDRIGYGQGCTLSQDTDVTRTNVTIVLPSDPTMLGASVSVKCNKQQSMNENLS